MRPRALTLPTFLITRPAVWRRACIPAAEAVGAKSSITTTTSLPSNSTFSSMLLVADHSPGSVLRVKPAPKKACSKAVTSLLKTPVGPTTKTATSGTESTARGARKTAPSRATIRRRSRRCRTSWNRART